MKSSQYFSLTGFMGSGKSSLLEEISQKKKVHTIDLDHYLESFHQKSIFDLIWPENSFRKLEYEALVNIFREKKKGVTVIALGGGTLLKEESREIILRNSHLIYLEASFPTLEKRLQKKAERNKRPLLTQKNLQSLWEERIPYYQISKNKISTEASILDSYNSLVEVLQKNCYQGLL